MPEDLLVVDGLVTSYGSIEALHGVSLTVHKGMAVAVLGANGAGKSTLLHTISGIVHPNHGRIHFQGAGHHSDGSREDRQQGHLPGS